MSMVGGRMEVIEEGLTNMVVRRDDQVTKIFSDSSWTIWVMNLLQLMFLDWSFRDRMARSDNEIRAREVLTNLDIATPSIIHSMRSQITMEYVDGPTLLSVLMEGEPGTCLSAGFEKGEELFRVHRYGAAFVDSRCENTIISDDGLVTVDCELFLPHAGRFAQELDIASLTGTAKLAPPENYLAFMQGLEEGYGPVFGVRYSFRLFLGGVLALGYTMMTRDATEAVRVLKNWYLDFTRIVPY